MTPVAGTCSDINFRNNNVSIVHGPQGRGAYRTSGGVWYHGAAGWVTAPFQQYVVVISNIINNRTYRVAANQPMSITVSA